MKLSCSNCDYTVDVPDHRKDDLDLLAGEDCVLPSCEGVLIPDNDPGLHFLDEAGDFMPKEINPFLAGMPGRMTATEKTIRLPGFPDVTDHMTDAIRYLLIHGKAMMKAEKFPESDLRAEAAAKTKRKRSEIPDTLGECYGGNRW